MPITLDDPLGDQNGPLTPGWEMSVDAQCRLMTGISQMS